MSCSSPRREDAVSGPADCDVWLCCFPHPGFRLHAVEYPGREVRFGEPIPEDLADLVAELAHRLAPFLRPPFAFFGHSFGALVATQVSRLLLRLERDLPLRLFLSGARAPQLAPRPAIGHLPDAEFVARLCEFKGMPREVLEDAQMMDLVLPIIRADFRLLETHHWEADQPLPVPISVFGGLADRTAPPAEILAWSAMTSKVFRSRFFEGDHFFPVAERARLAACIVEDLSVTGPLRRVPVH
jgi:medium-chain acyl-[acyl-carrier-protein] hydrolase